MIEPHARQRISLAVAAILVLAVSACANRSDVSSAIRELVFEKKMTTIRLADATSFAWDQAYLFGPYTPRSAVCNTLRIQGGDCERLVPFESQDDGEMSIAFLAAGHLVRYVPHSRGNGDFTPAPAQALSPRTATFSVVQDPVANAPKPWTRLVLTAQ